MKYLQTLLFALFVFSALSADPTVVPSADEKTKVVTLTITCPIANPKTFYAVGGLNEVNVKATTVQQIKDKLGSLPSFIDVDWSFYLTGTTNVLTIQGIKNYDDMYFVGVYCTDGTTTSTQGTSSWKQPTNGGKDFKITFSYNISMSLANQSFQASAVGKLWTIDSKLLSDQYGNTGLNVSEAIVQTKAPFNYTTYIGVNYGAATDNTYSNIQTALNKDNIAATIKSFSDSLKLLKADIIAITGVVITPAVPSLSVYGTVGGTNDEPKLIVTLPKVTQVVRVAWAVDTSDSGHQYSNVANLFNGLDSTGKIKAPLGGVVYVAGSGSDIVLSISGIKLKTNYDFSLAAASEGTPQDAVFSTATVSVSKLNSDIDIVSVTPKFDLKSKNVTVTVVCSEVPKAVYVVGTLASANTSVLFNTTIGDIQNNLTNKSNPYVNQDWTFYGIATSGIASTSVDVMVSGIKNANVNYQAMAYCSADLSNSKNMSSGIWVQPDNGGKEVKLELSYVNASTDLTTTKQAIALAKVFGVKKNNIVYDQLGGSVNPSPSRFFVSLIKQRMLTKVSDSVNVTFITFFARDYSLSQDDLHVVLDTAFNASNHTNLNTTYQNIKAAIGIAPSGSGLKNISYQEPKFTVNGSLSDGKINLNFTFLNIGSRYAWVIEPVTNVTLNYTYTVESIFAGKNSTGGKSTMSGSGYVLVNVSKIETVSNVTNSQNYTVHYAAIGEGIPEEAIQSKVGQIFVNYGKMLLFGMGGLIFLIAALFN